MPAGMISSLPTPALAASLELAHARAADGIRVADLADAAGYSPHHFGRLFSASMGVSPAQYVGALRIDAAKRALLARPDPVVDIAMEVGFESLSSFARRFRESVGVPPAALRHLAHDVAASTLTPFSIVAGSGATVRVRLEADPGPRGDPGPGVPRATWVGWYPRPSPIGLPVQGVLTWLDEFELPLCPGNPWLLAYSVPTTVESVDVLAPTRPLVAIHPAPLFSPGALTLRLRRAHPYAVPLLSALPSLRRRVEA